MSIVAILCSLDRGAVARKKAEVARAEQEQKQNEIKRKVQLRRDAAILEAVRQRDVKQLFLEYDVNGTGKLEREEIVRLIMDAFSLRGTRPSDDQVDFIMRAVCMKKHGADLMTDPVCKCSRLNSLEPDDIAVLLEAWSAFADDRQVWEDIFKAYYFDISKKEKLSKEEFKDYLIDLNQGDPVPGEVLDYIFRQADVTGDGYLNIFELKRAAALWHDPAQKKKRRMTQRVQGQ